jgi:hypothetical protein
MTIVTLLALLAAAGGRPEMTTMHSQPPDHLVQVAMTCFKSGEQTSGMNKICYYNCLGSQAAITIPAISLCPLSIDR